MNRSKAIDILRALAVLLVIGRHMDRCPERVSPPMHSFTDKWVNGGWLGVDLFFLLSGFLVSGLLFREHQKFGNISIKSFLIRRGFKIYPAFWLLTLVTLAFLFLCHDRFNPLAIPCEFLFVQNYGPSLWVHTWSLAVEEHFYFFLVIFLTLLSRIRPARNAFRIVPVVFVALAIMCLTLRILTWYIAPVFIDKIHTFPTHLRIDGLFCGVVISYFYHRHPNQFMEWTSRWRWYLFAAGLLLLAPYFCFEMKSVPFVFTFGFTLIYIGGASLFMALMTVDIPEAFIPKAVAYVGSHSYSIYLWHYPVIKWLVPFVAGTVKEQRNWLLYFATYVLGSIIFGIGMATLVEFPLLRLRDRWFPSRGRPLSTHDATPPVA